MGRRRTRDSFNYSSNFNYGDDNSSSMEPLFSSSFPTPPRRQAPSLHDMSFDQENGATFRHADSTNRALAALAQAKHERVERQKAIGLLAVLALTAISFHGISAGYFRSAVGNLMEFRPTVPNSNLGKRISVGRGGRNGEEDTNRTSTTAMSEQDLLEERVVSRFSGLMDVASPRIESERPLFWHVPRAAGTTIKNAMGQCLGLVSASEGGKQDQPAQMIEVVDVKGMKYVNVDTTNLAGITHAKSLHLAESGLADVIISSYLRESSSLFTPDFPGRAFTIMRDPVDRATSMYYYRSSAYGDLNGVSLEEYARGAGIENNWMTRFLTGVLEGELEKEHLEHAKIILKRKFLIGFLDDLDESIFRFMKYNGWEFSDIDTEQLNQEECLKTLTQVGTNTNPVSYETPQRGTQAFALITWQTQYDMKLYEYARELFDKQTKQWGSKERKKKDKKKKKKGGKL